MVVTIVDAHNYATFAPLLFEAAVGVIVPEDVARPVRSFLGRRGHTTFRLGEVVAVDWEGRHVELAGYLADVLWRSFVPGLSRDPARADARTRMNTSTLTSTERAARSCVQARRAQAWH